MTAPVEPPREMGERARNWVRAQIFEKRGRVEPTYVGDEAMIGSLAADFTAIRAEAIEECAKVAEAEGDTFVNREPRSGAYRIATALRSLSPKGAGKS